MSYGFGIVGCGMIAHFHAKAIQQLKGGKLVAVFTGHPEKAGSVIKGTKNCTVYTDYDAFLKHPGLDIVNICTPSGAHMEPAVTAAKSGKHVVVEKPLEITLKRCDKIITTCDKAGVQLCTIFPSRFSPVNQTLKKAIDSGKFGRLTLGDTYVKWWRSQEYYDSGDWRGTWDLDGGGALMNQAIHNVDLLIWLMGPIVECGAITDTLSHKRIDVEDTAVVTVRFENGALGIIEATTSAHPGLLRKVEIHGTLGTAIVEQEHLLLWQFDPMTAQDRRIKRKFAQGSATQGGAADPKAISHQGHHDQLKDFIQALKNRTAPLVDGREGRHSVEMVLAVYKASETGRRVTLPLKSDPRIAQRSGLKRQ